MSAPIISCVEDTEEVSVKKPHDRFRVWKGKDVFHQDLSVQVRLEPDGSVYLSTQEGHVSTLKSKTITIEQFHQVIRNVIIGDESKERLIPLTRGRDPHTVDLINSMKVGDSIVVPSRKYANYANAIRFRGFKPRVKSLGNGTVRLWADPT